MVGRKIHIYADGADLKAMGDLAERCDGCTTNPSLMKKAGITDYRSFGREVLAIWQGKPVSFEVLADDMETMERQAREIADWGENVFVKIPITNSQGTSTASLITALSFRKVKLNVTAVFTEGQSRVASSAMQNVGNIISVFAGRIADTGVNPAKTVTRCVMAARMAVAKVLWASARQVYSVVEAEEAGADIITLTPDLIAKLDGFGRDLEEYSLETVRQFAKDAEGISL